MQVFIEKKGVQSHKKMNCKAQEYKFTLICYIYFDTILIICVIMRDPVPFSEGLCNSSQRTVNYMHCLKSTRIMERILRLPHLADLNLCSMCTVCLWGMLNDKVSGK